MPMPRPLLLRQHHGLPTAAVLALTAAAVVPVARAFYLPGVAPIEYPEGGRVELKVNKLISVKTQLPYEYYTLPFCKPSKVQESVENLGEILVGDVIENSPYEIRMLRNITCKVLCKVPLDS